MRPLLFITCISLSFFAPEHTGEELYIHASNGSVILPGGYATNNHNHHTNQNNNTSTTNVPSSLSVQQLSTSQLSGGLLHNNGSVGGGGANASNTATSGGGGGGTVPHSQSAHEIGQQVPLTPLAQHQQALHHQLQLRFAANNNANNASSSGECLF